MLRLIGSLSEEGQSACLVGAHLANCTTEEFGEDGLVELLSLTSGRLTAVWRQEATAINTKAANSTTINFAAAGCYSAFSIQRRFLRQTAAPSQL